MTFLIISILFQW